MAPDLTDDAGPLELGDRLGKGGEASIFSLKSDPATLVKLYHHPTPERAEKLAVMIAHPPPQLAINGEPVIAWPIRRVFSGDDKRCSGFVMPRVTGGIQAANLHNMKSRLLANPHFTWKYLVRSAMNLSLTVDKVHAGGSVIGDVNDRGVLVASNALVALVDCDSFQVTDPATGRVYRSTVGMSLFTPPELAGCHFADVDRTSNHDLFGLAVLVYQLLMGSHPFQIKAPEPDEAITIEDAIRHGLYPDLVATVSQSPVSPALEILPSSTRALFRAAFAPLADQRPAAATWARELWTLDREQRGCARNPRHVFAAHVGSCPWCERVARVGGRDPFPSPDAIRAGAHLRRAGWTRAWASPRPRVPPARQWTRADTSSAPEPATSSRDRSAQTTSGRLKSL